VPLVQAVAASRLRRPARRRTLRTAAIGRFFHPTSDTPVPEKPTPAAPTFFATPAEWRAWLREHHATERELLVGFYRVASGRPSITWPQSVDQALCFGWIDGIRRGIDGESYSIRFTPRKRTSIWSAVNIRRAQELIDQGLMQPAGLAAFEARTGDRSGIYSFEQKERPELSPEFAAEFRANPEAWAFYEARAPYYRRTSAWWVMSAKREETRRKRLAQLIADSAAGRLLKQLTPIRKPKKSKE
jgi:uncharacterized protein YdeI (YjbR/CyaY-like superfamily)